MKRRGKVLILLVIVGILYSFFRVSLNVQNVVPVKSYLMNFTDRHEERNIFTFLTHPKRRCLQDCVNGTIIMVLSKSSHIMQRRNIRKTWGNLETQIKYNLCVKFLVGYERSVTLRTEIDEFGDTIQVDILESYYNLTKKTIAAFQWVTQFCNETRFFFKVDDDAFVNIAKLNKIQQKYNLLLEDRILGACTQYNLPWREESKWKVSYEEYPFETYPPFCFGPGYLMTSSTARKLHQEMYRTRLFKLEDVYIGMVAYRLGIIVQDVDHFIYDFASHPLLNQIFIDFYMQCSVIIHYVSKEHIEQLWNERRKLQCNVGQCSIWRKALCIFRM
ncbi:beta-1,3-galactosyltransferase 5-like [Ylistrum balloti]|uniref:beta-1,3-galactosyltransferase 5-like n=1 Tax=Ylistrum balloti TaxID=509963 RepID=UPI002905A3CC|nr:beta-1,3-galactosyltransferase 5-like [Ylistrum balloti]